MQIKLNGWQRIGILVSVVWLIGFAGYMEHVWSHEEHQEETKINGMTIREGKGEIYRLQYECTRDEASLWQDEKGNVEWSKMSIFEATFARCLYRARVNFIAPFLAVDFGMVVFGWLVGWLGIVVTRWVRRGFA